MSAVLVQLAEAIATDIGTHTFASVGDVTAVRSYADWDDELKDMGELHVDVVPANHGNTELETRGSWLYECAVDIGVRKRFAMADQDSAGKINNAAVDELVQFVEEIHEFFSVENFRLSTMPEAAWTNTKIRVTYIREHLRTHRQFTGIVQVWFRVPKDYA